MPQVGTCCCWMRSSYDFRYPEISLGQSKLGPISKGLFVQQRLGGRQVFRVAEKRVKLLAIKLQL
jgi:hypothetical protein